MNNPKSYRYYASTSTDAWDQETIRNVFRMTMEQRDGDWFPVREESWQPLTGTWGQLDNYLIRRYWLTGIEFDDISEKYALDWIEDQANRELHMQEHLMTFAEGAATTWLIKTPDREARDDDYPYVQAIKQDNKFFFEFSANKFLTTPLKQNQIEAILAAGFKEPDKDNSPNYWREFREDDSAQKIAAEVFQALRAAFIPEEPDVYNIRWFALTNNEGKRMAFYRTKYDGIMMRESQVWNTTDECWQPDRDTMHKWWAFGDTNIDEIDLGEAEAYLPKAAFER
ncbi:MAG: hypothetical protein RL167_541 [Actinomycetota bacterium]|jgi:hypothetical protein